MLKLSIGLAALGLLLLVASFIPWSAAPEPALPTAVPQVAPLSDLAAQGRVLFQAKGCVTCHRYEGFARPDEFFLDIAPDLTHYQPDPAFVREWLRDPAAIRPNTLMPRLDLDETEIEALLAFLAAGSPGN
ncbi:MAG: c-type cytochrome [Chloroflexota bacterium]